MKPFSTLFIFFLLIAPIMAGQNKDSETVYVGTYTKKEGHVDGQADGILMLQRNHKTGEITGGKLAAEVVNPSFVKTSEDGKFLFAVSELGEADGPSGYVYSFRINPDQSLTQLSKISSEGYAPCHLETDKSGKYLFVSNYSGGVVNMFNIGSEGSLEERQKVVLDNPKQSHAHSVTISTDNKKAYVADLGNDKIWIYDLDQKKGKLISAKPAFVALKSGSGPRHFVISEDQKFGYSINELNSSISVFIILKKGDLREIQNISSLPRGYTGKNSAADIHFHPSGKFLYASNRGHNSIVGFEVDPESGKLTSPKFTPTLGRTPRNFALSPDGKFLYVANQDSGDVAFFAISEIDGSLKQNSRLLKVATPVCLELPPKR